MKINVTKLQKRLEWLFAFLVLQLASGSLLAVFLSTEAQNSSVERLSTDNPIMQIIWLFIYIVSFGLILLRPNQLIGVLKRDKLLLLLVGLTVLSYFWSFLPELTLRRSIALVGTTVFAIYLVTRYNSGQLLRLFIWTMSIGAILSPLFALALPSYGITVGGGWQGFYQHKNLMGRLMGLNAVLLLLLNTCERKYRWVMWAGIGLSVALVLLSTSKGALVNFVVLLSLYPLYRSLQWKYTLVIPCLLIFILLGVSLALVITANLETIVVETLGKDITLTGRTVLWELVAQMISLRPILGYGYDGFWRGLEGPSAPILIAANWAVPHAHNGFLDLWLDLGIVGVVIFIIGFLMSLIRSIKWLRLTKQIEDLWPIVVLTATLLYNLAESTILERNHFLWIFYVVTVLARPMPQYNQAKKLQYQSTVTQ